MRKKTTYLLGILLTIVVGSVLYYYLCCQACCAAQGCKKPKQDTNTNVVEPQATPSVTRNALNIADANGDLNIKVNDNFNFKISEFAILEPLTQSVNGGVDELKGYLQNNPLKTVDIVGYYKSDETNTSAFPNLGLARANAVKNHMVAQGIMAKQINTSGELNDAIIPDDANTLFGPLKFEILTNEEGAKDEALEAVCEAIKANPLVLYFKTGQAQINLTAAQRQKIADISKCVDKLDAKVLVVGHTDNTGAASTNLGLGQQRANFAKDYFVKNGILESNIDATSKGETQPIANNSTAEGREKNRRTVITIN